MKKYHTAIMVLLVNSAIIFMLATQMSEMPCNSRTIAPILVKLVVYEKKTRTLVTK